MDYVYVGTEVHEISEALDIAGVVLKVKQIQIENKVE